MSYQVFRTPTYPSAVPVQSPLLKVSESPFPAGDPQGGQRAFPALLGLSPQGLLLLEPSSPVCQYPGPLQGLTEL